MSFVFFITRSINMFNVFTSFYVSKQCLINDVLPVPCACTVL